MSIPCAAEWCSLHSGRLVFSYLLSSKANVNLLPALALENYSTSADWLRSFS